MEIYFDVIISFLAIVQLSILYLWFKEQNCFVFLIKTLIADLKKLVK